MSTINFSGVFPALTTPFTTAGEVDLDFLAKHANWMIDEGCHGIVACGSLGEGATLTLDERFAILEALVGAVGDRVPVVAGIAALSTPEAVRLAQSAEIAGCKGLMVLPAYSYSTDWRESKAHIKAVIEATPLPCILYNNPIAYKTDYLPEQIAELAAELPNLAAVKESSSDVRRVTAIRALLGDRLTLMVGVDDAIVEAIGVGATGWIAGLVNAFPRESVALWKWALEGKKDEVRALYEWFLPLLRLDTVPKLVQLIKLAQQKVDMGSVTVRGPRLELSAEELAEATAIIDHALATRPIV